MSTVPYVSRINQIDVVQLDDEIFNILKQQSNEITKFYPPGAVGKWQPEIDALLKLAIWNFSLKTGNSTFGQRLLSLNYANFDRRKAILYVLLAILPKYLQDRLADTRYVTTSESNDKIKTCIEWTVNVVHLLSFVNLLLFLRRGTQPYVIERLLGISSQSTTTYKPRNIGYSYMTRELLWHGLIELFTIGLPMVNFHYIKQKALRLWSRRKEKTYREAYPTMDFATRCPYCHESPILPRHAGCEHVFCYYCLKAHFTAAPTFQCPACGNELHAANMKTL